MSERTTRKERTDIWATVAGAVIAVLFVAVRVLELVRAEGVPSTVGRIAGPNAVDEGSGVVADVLSPVTAGLLWSAVVVELLALVALAGLVGAIAVRCLRGRFFDQRTVSLLWATSWVGISYLVLFSALSRLGDNMAMRDLGLEWRDLDSWNWSWFIVVYLFTMFVSLMAVAFRRAAVMSRDQEGLV
jgi:hypothetical protein